MNGFRNGDEEPCCEGSRPAHRNCLIPLRRVDRMRHGKWSSQGVVDSPSRRLLRRFKLLAAQATEMVVATRAIVERIDVMFLFGCMVVLAKKPALRHERRRQLQVFRADHFATSQLPRSFSAGKELMPFTRDLSLRIATCGPRRSARAASGRSARDYPGSAIASAARRRGRSRSTTRVLVCGRCRNRARS